MFVYRDIHISIYYELTDYLFERVKPSETYFLEEMGHSIGSILSLLIFLQFIAIIFSTGPVHEDIIQWWNNLSVQRPVKCNLNPLYKVSSSLRILYLDTD